NTKTICINGSLPKFYYGDNVRSITPDKLNDVLLQLNDELGIPILKGDLTRIDVAESFPVKGSLLNYTNCLIETPNYYSSRDVHGIRYSKNNIVLAFYDKSSESIKSGEYYHYTEKVLRIELRLTSHLRRTLYPKSENLKAV